MERDTTTTAEPETTTDFNSHAHVERDKIVAKFGVFKDISTHTLTWSVTPEIRKTGLKTFYFNSHAHVERDAELAEIQDKLRISTHTLTWSVT